MPRVSIKHIAIDPDYCSGKPRIAETRMPVATIAQLHLEMGETLGAIQYINYPMMWNNAISRLKADGNKHYKINQ